MSPLRTLTLATVLCALLSWPALSLASATPRDTQEEALRHGLGTATASALYHTHLFISATADGYKGKIFDEQQVRSALSASAKVTTALMDDLTRVKKGSTSQEDVQKLEAMIATCEMVLKEARLISGMIRLGTPEAERSYAEHHQRVRAHLTRLLGL